MALFKKRTKDSSSLTARTFEGFPRLSDITRNIYFAQSLEGLRNEKSSHHGRVSSKQRESMGSCEGSIHVHVV